jgi:nitrite reductase/ring-hydroxylating ferredoxin subunit
MAVKKLKRNIFQRILGIPATRPPSDGACWSSEGNKLIIDLASAKELSQPGSAIRIEGKSCSERVLVLRGEDGKWHAYRNRCGHMGRRLDPVPGTETVQCCSINAATYGYDCHKIEGPGEHPVNRYPVEEKDGKLHIALSPS